MGYERDEYEVSDVSKAKSRRTCWMSDDHRQNVDITSTTATRTPKKVNFRSVEEVRIY